MTATEAFFLLAGLGLGVLAGVVVERWNEGRPAKRLEKKRRQLQKKRAQQAMSAWWEDYKKRQGPDGIK